MRYRMRHEDLALASLGVTSHQSFRFSRRFAARGMDVGSSALAKPAALIRCPCGYFGDPLRACTCSASTVTRYQHRISGPLLDRIDIHVEVPRVEFEKLSDQRLGEPSAAIRERVEAARRLQRERLSAAGLACNADMGVAEVRQICVLDDAGRALVRQAMAQLQLSARAFHRILKLARTIADLEGAQALAPVHLAEALQYRPRRWA